MLLHYWEVQLVDEKVDIYMRLLELAETTLEGIEHIYDRTMYGCFEDTSGLFTDVADSFHEIKKALLAYMPEYAENELDKISDEVIEGMKMLLLAYEGDQDVRPMVVLQFALLPAFRRWHVELQENLGQICAPSMN